MTEQIQELSKKTLSSYIKHSIRDAHIKKYNAGTSKSVADHWSKVKDDAIASGDTKVAKYTDAVDISNDRARHYNAKADKRVAGISKAARKLAEEQIEEELQLDELSKGTLASYITKASAASLPHAYNHATLGYTRNALFIQRDRLKKAGDEVGAKQKQKEIRKSQRDERKSRDLAGKRQLGVERAARKMAEEYELHEEGIEMELNEQEMAELTAQFNEEMYDEFLAEAIEQIRSAGLPIMEQYALERKTTAQILEMYEDGFVIVEAEGDRRKIVNAAKNIDREVVTTKKGLIHKNHDKEGGEPVAIRKGRGRPKADDGVKKFDSLSFANFLSGNKAALAAHASQKKGKKIKGSGNVDTAD